MTYVITEACLDVNEGSCIDVCPVDCIYDGTRMKFIQPDECTDCGACEPECPVDAIYYEADLPPDLADYTALNAAAFTQLVAPGEHVVADPPEIAARPRS